MSRPLHTYLAYSPKAAPVMIATRFHQRFGAWPAEVVYPPDAAQPDDGQRLEGWGVAISTDPGARNLAYAGPRPEGM